MANTPSLYDQYSNYLNNYGTPAQTNWSGPGAYGLLGVTPSQNFSGDGSSQEAQAQLAQLQHYDPNARIVVTQTTNSDTGQTSPQYHFQYDTSKLPMPALAAGGNLAQAGAQGQTNLRNPSAVTNDPNFGPITATNNVIRDNGGGWLDTVGPALVAAFGGAASLGLLGSGGAGASFDPSLSVGSAMPPYDPGYGSMLSFNPSDADLGIGGSAASGASGAAGAAVDNVPGGMPGGLGGGAADELANGGQYIAGAPAANQTSIDVSNWLAAHGLPTQLGLSDGALGAAASESGFGLGQIGSALSGAASALGKIPAIGGSTGGGGASGGGGGLLQPYRMQPYSSLTQVLRSFGLLGQANG